MPGICRRVVLSTLLLGVQPATALTQAEVGGCTLARDRAAIGQCTAVIDSRRWTGRNIAWAYFNRGLVYENALSDHAHAISDFTSAIDNNPDEWKAYSMRGLCYMRADDNSHALDDLNRALAMRPDDLVSLQDRGDVYVKLGDFDRAITDFNAVLDADAGNAHAWGDRGFAHFKRNEYEKALRDLDRAVTIDPRDPVSLVNRGDVKLATGDVPGADADYAAARALRQ